MKQTTGTRIQVQAMSSSSFLAPHNIMTPALRPPIEERADPASDEECYGTLPIGVQLNSVRLHSGVSAMPIPQLGSPTQRVQVQGAQMATKQMPAASALRPIGTHQLTSIPVLPQAALADEQYMTSPSSIIAAPEMPSECSIHQLPPPAKSLTFHYDLEACMLRCAHRRCIAVFALWGAFSQDMRTLRHIVTAISCSALRRAIAQWIVYRQQTALAWRVRNVFAATRVSKRKRVALGLWRLKIRNQRLLHWASATLMHRKSRRALTRWIETFANFKRVQRAVAATTQPQYRAFITWIRSAANMRQYKLKLTSSLAKILRNGLWRALHQWVAIMRAVTGARRRVRLAVEEWCGARLFAAFTTWSAVASREIQRLQQVDSALRRLRAPRVHRALTTWTAQCARRQRVRRVAMALVHRQCHRAMATWVQAVLDRGEVRRQLQRSGNALHHNLLWRALNQWVTVMLAAREVQHGRRRRQCLMLAAVTALRCTDLWRALHQWVAIMRAVTGARRRVRLAVEEWCGARLFGAFTTWSAVASREIQRLQRMRRVAMALIDRQLFAAFTGWSEAVNCAMRRLRLHERAGCRFCLLSAQRALNIWMLRTLSTSYQLQMLYRALASLVHQQLHRALNTWRAAVARLRDQRRWQIRSICAMRRKVLFHAVQAWRAQASAGRRAYSTLTGTIAAMHCTCLRRAINQWVATCSNAAAARRTLRVSLGSWRGTNLRKAHNTWLLYRQRRLQEAAERKARSLAADAAASAFMAASAAAYAAQAFEELEEETDHWVCIAGSTRTVGIPPSMGTMSSRAAAARYEAKRVADEWHCRASQVEWLDRQVVHILSAEQREAIHHLKTTLA